MGRRGFAFLFLEPFLVVVAIKTEWETIASETKDVAGSVYTVVTARLSFTPGAWWRQGKTACEAPQPARRKERNDTRITNLHVVPFDPGATGLLSLSIHHSKCSDPGGEA